MYHFYASNYGSRLEENMRKWIALLLLLLLLSGCSTRSFWKWIDEMDWERTDQTVSIVDFVIK
jgi:hypothetical protein